MILNPGISSTQKTFIVVGVQRGGTSMVAGVMRELGINLGTNLGSNHEDPEFLPKEIDRLLDVIAQRNSKFDVWGWKMPHTSEYLLEILDNVRNPHVVVVFRNLLAMAESQMKRSSAGFENAFKFSTNRLVQVAGIIPAIHCPLQLVDYDLALRQPDNFVGELINFAGIYPDATKIRNALRLIDPEKGYQRTSDESWSYTVTNGNALHNRKVRPLKAQRRMLNLFPEANVLKRKDEHAFVEFILEEQPDQGQVELEMLRNGDADSVRIIVDVGKGFSGNMQERVQLYKGKNRVSIRMPSIKGIRIYPEFDSIVSNVSLITLNQCEIADV